jgi:predicted ATPase with chaperone activity
MISAKKPNIAALRQAMHDEAARKSPKPASGQAGIQLQPPTADSPQEPSHGFRPSSVQTVQETGLSEALVEALVFKHLLAVGHATGRAIAVAVGIPPKPIIALLANLKSRQFVFYTDSTAMGDFEYALTDAGRSRARNYMDECSYVGPAPVTLVDYIASVKAQSITKELPHRDDLERAFSDLLINEQIYASLGPAINSGRGLFLYGAPGNGKTSIAERITSCFGGTVWVPYAIYVSGELITFYDPENHVAVESDGGATRNAGLDPRWIEVRRPTIIAGGELTMASLDLLNNKQTKITEPSLQLKSNTGTLVIDDFGRQRMSPLELLNRWIVPLEKRYDYLTLSNGKKIKVPFDQLIIFSTNLEPKDLVDEAFLRRIPYKINVIDPSEIEFRKLFDIMAPIIGVQVETGAIDTLIEKHYKSAQRSYRCCQPRDLLLQIKNYAAYHNEPPIANEENFDAAVLNYFAVM